MKKYKKSVTRECSLFDVKAWNEGESLELEKHIGLGFFNHIFVSENGMVTFYYSLEEAEKFEKWMEENFTEEFFNDLCDGFYELVEQIENVASNEEVFSLCVKMWPAWLFFDELSKYPGWGNDTMVRRLLRLRTMTESADYELANKAKVQDYKKDYIFFKGEIHDKSFDDFCSEKGIKIVD